MGLYRDQTLPMAAATVFSPARFAVKGEKPIDLAVTNHYLNGFNINPQ